MKKGRGWTVFFVLALLLTALPARASEGIRILLDGHELSFDVPPVEVSGRLLVPMRALFERLGCSVSWDGERQSVSATTSSGVPVTLWVGQAAAQVNGQITLLDVAPQIVADRTLVPLRFVSETLGADVKWDGPTQTVSIRSGSHTVQPSSRLTAPATTEQLLDRAMPATVLIETQTTHGEKQGTGFFINDQGFIVTNYHVMQGAVGIRVTTYDKKTYDKGIVLVAADPNRDVAVLLTDAMGYAPLPLDIGTAPKVGSQVITVGNPMGLDWSASEGMVSGTERTIKGLPWIQHSAPISPGNSGGPLISKSSGKIIGMNTMMLAGQGIQNLNFAVPTASILSVLGNWGQELPPAPTAPAGPTPTPAPSPPPAPAPESVALPAMPATPAPGDWVNPRGDLLNRAALSAGPGAAMGPAWTAPSVGAGRGLTLHGHMLYAADNMSPGTLTGIDPTTGKVLWSKRLGSAITTATADDNGAYLTEVGQSVRAFRPDGTTLWLANVPGWSTPILMEKQLLVVDRNTTVDALDPATGAVLWKATAPEASIWPTAQPLVLGERMYVPTPNKTLVLDLASHQWQPAIQRTTSTTLLADNGRLYMTQGRQLYAVHPLTGQDLWSVPVGDNVTGAPAAARGLVVFAAADSSLYAVDGTTGKLVWSQPLDTYGSGGPALIAGDLVYAGAYSKGLKVFRLDTGDPAGTLAPDARVIGTPVATDRYLFVPGDTWGVTGLVKQ